MPIKIYWTLSLSTSMPWTLGSKINVFFNLGKNKGTNFNRWRLCSYRCLIRGHSIYSYSLGWVFQTVLHFHLLGISNRFRRNISHVVRPPLPISLNSRRRRREVLPVLRSMLCNQSSANSRILYTHPTVLGLGLWLRLGLGLGLWLRLGLGLWLRLGLGLG